MFVDTHFWTVVILINSPITSLILIDFSLHEFGHKVQKNQCELFFDFFYSAPELRQADRAEAGQAGRAHKAIRLHRNNWLKMAPN